MLTDIRMPPSHTDEGIQIANRLRATHPEVGVIVLSQYDEPVYALSLLESARTVADICSRSASTSRRELRDAVQAVVRGGAVIDPSLVDALVQGQGGDRALGARRAVAARAPGSGRDRPGQSYSAIAESLVLSKRAVEKHINSIFLKLGLGFADDVSKRVKATLMYLSESELPAPAAAGDD